MSRITYFVGNRLRDGGVVDSFTRRPHFTLQEFFVVLIPVRFLKLASYGLALIWIRLPCLGISRRVLTCSIDPMMDDNIRVYGRKKISRWLRLASTLPKFCAGFSLSWNTTCRSVELEYAPCAMLLYNTGQRPNLVEMLQLLAIDTVKRLLHLSRNRKTILNL
jgi:hypothetical protein